MFVCVCYAHTWHSKGKLLASSASATMQGWGWFPEIKLSLVATSTFLTHTHHTPENATLSSKRVTAYFNFISDITAIPRPRRPAFVALCNLSVSQGLEKISFKATLSDLDTK